MPANPLLSLSPEGHVPGEERQGTEVLHEQYLPHTSEPPKNKCAIEQTLKVYFLTSSACHGERDSNKAIQGNTSIELQLNASGDHAMLATISTHELSLLQMNKLLAPKDEYKSNFNAYLQCTLHSLSNMATHQYSFREEGSI